MTRDQIVAQARTHLHAKFRHQGRSARALDCAGLPLLVAVELGLRDTQGELFRLDMYGNYGRQEIRGRLLEITRKHMTERLPLEMGAGDVIILANPTVACHAAIVSMLPSLAHGELAMQGMIHAHGTGAIGQGTRPPRGGEQVVEHLIDAEWRSKIRGVFSFPEVR